ncbi:MAG: hypothetical protein JNK85_07990 [Verrucomicrobiales bacterium]|nr:hypothetical protein [Verrucomicrobiales bacterium]
MTKIAFGCAVFAAMMCGRWCAAAEGNGRSPFESSVVTLEVTSKDYDYFQPWTKPTRSVRKHALVVGEKELVTTAQNLADQTLVRVQKRGRGRWYNAEVRWVDYHANLGVISVADDAFWTGLKAVELSGTVPRRNDYEILRWRDGNLEMRRADFSKFTVSEGSMSFAPRIQLELNTEIGGLGWAEPVLADGKVVGLTVSKGGNVCTVMPTPFMARVLEAKKAGRFPGLGFFDFVWQAGQNPATLEYLRVPGEPRGAVVIEVPKRAAEDYALKTRDVLLEVDGFPIDMEGDYEDPDYGHVMLEGLATRGHFAGDKVRMKILREGKEVEIQYELPKADFSVDLLPMFVFDKEPEYLVAGGLVFQPLHQQYLRGWGDDWRRRAPFRLVYATSEGPTKERPTVVILSQVLPDPINVGYQEVRNLVLEAVNGRTVRNLKDLQEALKSPKDGVHVIEFFRGDNLRRLLLDSGDLEASTARVLKRYGIPSASVIH